jgi:hypothetical protein
MRVQRIVPSISRSLIFTSATLRVRVSTLMLAAGGAADVGWLVAAYGLDAGMRLFGYHSFCVCVLTIYALLVVGVTHPLRR